MPVSISSRIISIKKEVMLLKVFKTVLYMFQQQIIPYILHQYE